MKNQNTEKLKKLDKEIGYINTAIKINPNNYVHYRSKAITLIKKGKILGEQTEYNKQAIECYNEAIKLKPDSKKLFIDKVKLFIDNKAYDIAAKELVLANIKIDELPNTINGRYVKYTLQNIYKIESIQKELAKLQEQDKTISNSVEPLSKSIKVDELKLTSVKSNDLEELYKRVEKLEQKVESLKSITNQPQNSFGEIDIHKTAELTRDSDDAVVINIGET